jgi:hypothetical protein
VIGIITFDAARLNKKHLSGLGIQETDKLTIVGCPENGTLRSVIRDGKPYVYADLEQELVSTAKTLVSRNPNVGAILLECTQLPVFAVAIQEAVRLPVYDVFTLGCWFYSGLVRKPFPEWSVTEVNEANLIRPRSLEEVTESAIFGDSYRARL